MKIALREFFRRKPVAIVLALALTGVFGLADYLTGREVAISAFYLIPIGWACWSGGLGAGLLAAVASTGVWLAADVGAGYPYAYRATPYWNGFMLLVLFVVVVLLLSAFQRAHYQLEETVQKRTAALHAEIAERKRAEAAKIQAERLAVVGAMAAEVAHEVRNPLGAIALNLDLVQKEIDRLAHHSRHPPDEGQLLVGEMRTEVQRIQHVIEDYLQFARLPKPRQQALALNEWLGQKLAFMNGTFQDARVKLRTTFDPALQTIRADPEQLWQAILNLIRNGLEAMSEGGELTVSTGRNGHEALVRIRDQGKGMTPDEVKQIFIPFFSTKPTGTGLGLALVQQVVTEHGGHVTCESTFGQGSTFIVFLPLEENKS